MLTDSLGLNTKPQNAVQPGTNADSEQLSLRDRMKKKRQPMAGDSQDKPTMEGQQ